MSTTRTSRWNRETCSRKVRHNALSALRLFIELAADGSVHPGFRVYACECCVGLHLGHYRPELKAPKLEKLAARGIIRRLIGRLAPGGGE